MIYMFNSIRTHNNFYKLVNCYLGMVRKKSMNKIALSILVSIILTVIIVSLVNVGLSIFMERPDYSDFCGEFKTQEIMDSQESCEAIGGKWNPEGKSYPPARAVDGDVQVIDGYCDRDFTCREELEEAEDDYDQKRYYVFALIGFTLLLIGLFSKEILIQITGLASGGILVFEGIVTNFDNKIVTFISLLLIFVVFGVLAYRIVNKD
jgi:hypothetical protein